MQLNVYTGDQGGLTAETKPGSWSGKELDEDMLFIHGGPMTPSQVRGSGGLDAVRFGREWVIDRDGAPIGGGKLIFTFLVVAGAEPPASYAKPPAVRRLWGDKGHCYIFSAPAGTTFYSSGPGQPRHGMEIAFPYLVELTDMRFYCTPTTTSTVIARSAEHRLGGPSFMKVPWASVMAAQAVPA